MRFNFPAQIVRFRPPIWNDVQFGFQCVASALRSLAGNQSAAPFQTLRCNPAKRMNASQFRQKFAFSVPNRRERQTAKNSFALSRNRGPVFSGKMVKEQVK